MCNCWGFGSEKSPRIPVALGYSIIGVTPKPGATRRYFPEWPLPARAGSGMLGAFRPAASGSESRAQGLQAAVVDGGFPDAIESCSDWLPLGCSY